MKRAAVILVILGAVAFISLGVYRVGENSKAEVLKNSEKSLKYILEYCIKTSLPTSEEIVGQGESERVVPQTDYKKLHKDLGDFQILVTDDVLDSIYDSMQYFKSNEVYSTSYIINHTKPEYNKSGRDYWRVIMSGDTDKNKYIQVIRLYTNEDNRIYECRVHSQRMIKK